MDDPVAGSSQLRQRVSGRRSRPTRCCTPNSSCGRASRGSLPPPASPWRSPKARAPATMQLRTYRRKKKNKKTHQQNEADPQGVADARELQDVVGHARRGAPITWFCSVHSNSLSRCTPPYSTPAHLSPHHLTPPDPISPVRGSDGGLVDWSADRSVGRSIGRSARRRCSVGRWVGRLVG